MTVDDVVERLTARVQEAKGNGQYAIFGARDVEHLLNVIVALEDKVARLRRGQS